MAEKCIGIVRSIFLEAIRIMGTQSALAEELGIDGGLLSKFMAGEGSLKMEVIEKVFEIVKARVVTGEEWSDTEAMLRGFSRRLLLRTV